MSAATEFAPVVHIPERARTRRSPERLATVTTLFQPGSETIAPPLRLTRRGAYAVAAAVALAAVVLVGIAWLCAPSSAAGPATTRSAPDFVTVTPGGSLWTIATRIAPDRDPRAVVDQLRRVNHLGDTPLVPGQVLRTH